MLEYTIRRLLLAVPVLLGVSILVFLLARVLPGDVFEAQAAGGAIISQEEIDMRREEEGLNDPLLVQYGDWLYHVIQLDFGESLYNRRSVNDELTRAIPVTIELTILAAVMGTVVAIALGVISAVWQGSVADYLARFFGVLGLSVPSFVMGSLAITYLAREFRWTPPAGYVSFFDDPSTNMEQFLIPAIILASGFSASVMRMTRSSVLAVLREDYVRTAMAKGLAPRYVVLRHVLRNALITVTTLAGAQIGFLMAGSVIIESIFSLSGVGSLTLNAIINRDYLVIQAITLILAAVFVLLNLIVDLMYAWLDPRIRLS